MPAESIINPIPSALTVNAPNIDQSKIEKINIRTAAKSIQLIGVVTESILSNLSGDLSLSSASLLKSRLLSISLHLLRESKLPSFRRLILQQMKSPLHHLPASHPESLYIFRHLLQRLYISL